MRATTTVTHAMPVPQPAAPPKTSRKKRPEPAPPVVADTDSEKE